MSVYKRLNIGIFFAIGYVQRINLIRLIQKYKMNTIPIELVHEICLYLHGEDLASARLAIKNIYNDPFKIVVKDDDSNRLDVNIIRAKYGLIKNMCYYEKHERRIYIHDKRLRFYAASEKSPVLSRIFANPLVQKKDPFLYEAITKLQNDSLPIMYHPDKDVYADYILRPRWPEVEELFIQDRYALSIYVDCVLATRVESLEKAIFDLDAQHVYLYLVNVYKRRVPSIEKKMLGNEYYLKRYVEEILEEPFPEGENIIRTCSRASYWYAKRCLKGRFLMGEKNIFRSGWSEDYIKEFIQQPDTNVEKYLLMHIVDAGIFYAKYVLCGRWSALEDKILETIRINGGFHATSLKYVAYNYAKIAIGGRWPELETIILKSYSYYVYRYINYCINARWPEYECLIEDKIRQLPYIKTEQYNQIHAQNKADMLLCPKELANYAIYVIRGRWPEIETYLNGFWEERKLYRRFAVYHQ